MGKPKTHEVTGTVSGFISDAYTDLEALRDEIQDWRDNLPENLQGGQKADELDTCLESLSNVDDVPELDEETPDLDVKAAQELPKKSWGETYISRGTRRDNAIALLDAAASALEDLKDGEPGTEAGHELAEKLREHISDFESAEFPGAF